MWSSYVIMLSLVYIHKTYIESESVAMLASVLVLVVAHLFSRIPNQKIFSTKNETASTIPHLAPPKQNQHVPRRLSGPVSTCQTAL